MAKHQSELSKFLILKRLASAFTTSAADGDSTQITLTLKKVRDKCKLFCCPEMLCRIHPAFRWLWKSACQNKHRVFFWLLMKDRLSTRGLLRRRNMELETYSCVLCSGQSEVTVEHLFLGCNFAQACWGSILLNVDPSLDPFRNLEWLMAQLNKPFFMEIIILMCWAIWVTRNNKIFNQVSASVQGCKRLFLTEMDALILRAKSSSAPRIQEWISSIA